MIDVLIGNIVLEVLTFHIPSWIDSVHDRSCVSLTRPPPEQTDASRPTYIFRMLMVQSESNGPSEGRSSSLKTRLGIVAVLNQEDTSISRLRDI